MRRLVIELPNIVGLERGASVCIDGVCLTAVDIAPGGVSFDVIAETLRLTSLGRLGASDRVNFERSATVGKEIGGHLVSGHVSGMARVVAREDSENNVRLAMQVEHGLIDYILPKGFVGVHGVSLTVGAVDEALGLFDVHLIPETLEVTVLGAIEVGDSLNIELDAMTQAVVETVRRVMARQQGAAS